MAAAGSRPVILQTPGDYGDFYSCCSVLQKIMPCHFDAFLQCFDTASEISFIRKAPAIIAAR